MRRGVTLAETLVCLIVAGLLMVIALPLFGPMRDRLAVDEAAARIAAAHRRARIIAILESRSVLLSVAADSLIITSDSIAPWRQGGPRELGVTMGGPRRLITFSPVGLTQGVANATFALTRGTAIRTVTVSRLGRLRVR